MNKQTIIDGLQKLGLQQGDIVLLHSSLASLGHVEGGADAVVDAFLDVLGVEGTLAVPTFGALGIITTIVKERANAVHSIHPKASVAAIGSKAEAICANHWKADTGHAEDTPYTKIAELGGYICLLGVDQDRNTTLHSVEELLRLSYLSKTQEVTFETPEGSVTKSWDYFPGPHRDFIGLDKLFRDSGKMLTETIGNSVVRLIKSSDLIDIAVEEGKRNPEFVLCDNPNCSDCVKQKAQLRKTFLENESFTLAASALLSGYYIPEIIDNLNSAGITHVELDYLRGRPIHLYNAEKIGSIIQAFHQENITVTALRLAVMPENVVAIAEAAIQNNVARLVLPLAAYPDELLKAVLNIGCELSFYNTAISAISATEILQGMKQQEIDAGFSFNCANFASVGEKPFLGSYKKKLRRFIDQLDIEDALIDGTAVALAQGNAEVKEMISILRCASYNGYMVLGSKNRFNGKLLDIMKQFKALIEAC